MDMSSTHSQHSSNVQGSQHSSAVLGSGHAGDTSQHSMTKETSELSMTTPVFEQKGSLTSEESISHPYNTSDKDFVNAKAFLLQASTLTGLNL